MSEPGIRFVAAGKLDGHLTYSIGLEKNYEKKFKQEAQSLLPKLKALNLKPDERQKIKSDNGSWFCTVDRNSVGFMALCNTYYAERYAFNFITEVQRELAAQCPNYWESNQEKNVTAKAPGFTQPLMAKYNDLEANDKLSQTQSTLNQVKSTASQNIMDLVENTGSLEILTDKSQKMKLLSQQVSQDSEKVARLMWKRRMRIRIVMGAIIISLILFVYFAFIH